MRQLAERLEYLVDHDHLTGLFNERRFEQELTREGGALRGMVRRGAVVLVDLDRFKHVNDAFGHKTGDERLKVVSLGLSHRMRQTDVLARVGGDEFAILLPPTGADQAGSVAEGIVATVRNRVSVGSERSIRVTASAGVWRCSTVTMRRQSSWTTRTTRDVRGEGSGARPFRSFRFGLLATKLATSAVTGRRRVRLSAKGTE